MNQEITVGDLENLCKAVTEQREIYEAEKARASEAKEELDKREHTLVECLKQLGKTSYKSNVGTVSISHRISVSVPKTPEAREAFFGYLKSRGVFDTLITVNSQTLNAFYKGEFETARAEGRGLEFVVPGLDEPKLFESLSVRKN